MSDIRGKRAGQKIGDYRLIQLLGQGSYAEVYLGKSESVENQRHVAVKVFNDLIPFNEIKARDMFLKEAKLLRKLEHHPHIIRLLDFDIDGTTPFLVMDYASNLSLLQRYHRGSCLPLETVVRYISQTAKAVQYAHDNDIIHCDLKPANLLLGSGDTIFVADFGIAKMIETTRTLLTIYGSPGTKVYMAPEMFKSQVSFQSDQYSMGVIVYEWLCGRPPFEGGEHELLYQHLHKRPLRLRSRNPAIPPEVEWVVHKALKKKPKDRFKDVEEFAHKLEHASRSSLSTVEQPVVQNFALRFIHTFSRLRVSWQTIILLVCLVILLLTSVLIGLSNWVLPTRHRSSTSYSNSDTGYRHSGTGYKHSGTGYRHSGYRHSGTGYKHSGTGYKHSGTGYKHSGTGYRHSGTGYRHSGTGYRHSGTGYRHSRGTGRSSLRWNALNQ